MNEYNNMRTLGAYTSSPRSDDMGIDAEIGSRVRVLRKAKQLSLREVGRELGLSHTFVGDLERGDKRWVYEYVEQFAEFYDVPASLLTDPTVPLAQIQQIADILAEVSSLPPQKLAAVLQMLRAMR